MTELTRENAYLSTTWNGYPAYQAIDNNMDTICASQGLTTAADLSLSVQVPAGSTIGYVAVYNRNDAAWAAAMLNPFEVWLTASPGTASTESSSAHKCADGLRDESVGTAPVMVNCGSRNDLRYVTIIIRAGPTSPFRLLSVAEVRVYTPP